MHATHKPFLHSLSCLIACLTLAATALAADIGPADALVAKDNVTKDKAAKDKAAPPLSKEARQQITRYRMARKPAQRAAAIVDLVALGDEGKTAAKELFEKELKLAEPAVRAAQQPTKFDAPLEKLRKVLAGLREDPNLTKDQLKNVGLPTLEELTAVYGQWTRATAGRTAKAGRVVAQLNEMVAVLKALQDKWPLDAPIPVNDYLNQSRGQLDKLSGKDDEEAKKVLAENRARAAKFPADLRSGMDEVNAVRIVCGLRPLLYDEKLCAAAIEHSTDMETHNYFSHEAPETEKKTPWDRAKLAGTTASGENIFKGGKRRPQCRQGLVPQPRAPQEHALRFGQAARSWPRRFDLDADVRELRHRVGQCLRRMSALLRNQRHVVARAAVGVVVVAAPAIGVQPPQPLAAGQLAAGGDLDRIEVNVTRHRQKVNMVLHELGLEPPLQLMARPPVLVSGVQSVGRLAAAA